MKIKIKGGAECDCFSKHWKNMIHWKAGERKSIKRRFHKRERRALKPKEEE